MSQKLYVGGLPFSFSDKQLEELFTSHGTIESAKVISDKYTGKSRGFGFVEFSSATDAQKAIAALNGTTLEGRTITVNEARQREHQPDKGGYGKRNRW